MIRPKPRPVPKKIQAAGAKLTTKVGKDTGGSPRGSENHAPANNSLEDDMFNIRSQRGLPVKHHPARVPSPAPSDQALDEPRGPEVDISQLGDEELLVGAKNLMSAEPVAPQPNTNDIPSNSFAFSLTS